MTKKVLHIVEDNIEKKKCSRCQIYRNLDNYNNSSQTWDKLRPECKICLTEKREANKEKMTEYNKKYWQETKEQQKEKNKIWRSNNQEKVKQSMKEWLEKNKEYKKLKDKEYREENWEKKKEYNRKWHKNNYEDLKNNIERVDEFNKYRIKTNISRRIREILKQDKSQSSSKYVGCSLDELKTHLETQFEEGMNWDNYGSYTFQEDKSGWHIDHIIPCTAFNLEDPIEVGACFYYMNLQPLWGKDNIIKSNTFDQDEKDKYLEMYKNIVANNNIDATIA
jgi:hypothetical protein